MPLSRDPRLDRRRRVLREGLLTAEDETVAETRPRANRSRPTAQTVNDQDAPAAKRSAGYSQSVRKACQHRLVQFIPARRRSLTAAVAASLLLPTILLATHYGIFVSEWLPWKNHPVAAVLDATHPRSLAAWLGSQLWLLCLAATVLTFRLRRHKLDDYEGEYRLWFWLVLTCLIGSVDSTTRVTELFGAALDRWSTLHVGWSGAAIVQATLATLVGMLGLRLCGELKAVPTSLVLWLVGLVCWAGSAALSQSLFKIELSYQSRLWLRASLWLGGLTALWLAALFYLRAVYIEAQRRFMLRGGWMSSESVPLRQRLARVLPKGQWFQPAARDPDQPNAAPEAAEYAKVPRDGRGGNLFRMFRKPADDAPLPAVEKRASVSTTALPSTAPPPNSPRNQSQLPSTTTANANRNKPIDRRLDSDKPAEETQPRRSWFSRSKPVPTAPRKKRTLRERFSWRRAPAQPTGDSKSLETTKPKANSNANGPSSGPVGAAKAIDRNATADQPQPAKKRRFRLPGIRLPKLKLPKLRLPKLKLPSFRLPPPQIGDGAGQKSGSTDQLRAVGNSSRPLPGTDPGTANAQSSNAPLGDSYARSSMSKAERKKLRRLGRDDDPDRRAA